MDRSRQYGLIALKDREQPRFHSELYYYTEEELQQVLKGLRVIHPHILVPFRLSLLLKWPVLQEFADLIDLHDGQFSGCAKRWLHRFLPPSKILTLLQEEKGCTIKWENTPILDQLVDWWRRDLHVLALFTSAQQEDFLCD